MTTRSKILSLIIGLFPLVYSFGQSSFQKVKVTNLENVKGTLYIGWYNKAVDFRINDKAIYRAETEVKNQDEVTVSFKDIPESKYAIAVFIDENGDYKLEKNFLEFLKNTGFQTTSFRNLGQLHLKSQALF